MIYCEDVQYVNLRRRVNFTFIWSNVQSDNERISCKLNVLIEYKSVCSGKSCLPMLLLVFSKHVIIESSRQTKHISVMLQMTPAAHIWVNRKQEFGCKHCMTAAQNLPATGLNKQNTSIVYWLWSQNSNYTETDAQTIISNQTCSHRFVLKAYTQHCVSKYHSAGLVNSQVYTPRTELDTRQTGIKQGALALNNQFPHCWDIQELWHCWYKGQHCVHNRLYKPLFVTVIQYHTTNPLTAAAQLSWYLIMLI